MRITHLLGVAAVLAAMMGSEAQAQVELEITPFTGGTFFLADPPQRFAVHRFGGQSPLILQNASFDHGFTLGANGGLRINEIWAVEAMFSWIPTELWATGGLSGSEKLNAFMYGLTGLFYIPLEGRVKPFLGLGVGGETFDYTSPDIDGHTEWMGNVAGGLYVAVSNQFGLRFEARDCFARFDSGVSTVDDAWENDLMLTLGFSFRTPLN